MIGLSYFTWEFLVTRPFHWYQNMWPWPLTYFSKTLTFGVTWMVCDRTFIFHKCIRYDKAFRLKTKFFTLTLTFDLLYKYFNFGHNFWMVSYMALIFHMCIPCYMIFPLIPTFLSPVTLSFNISPVSHVISHRLFLCERGLQFRPIDPCIAGRLCITIACSRTIKR